MRINDLTGLRLPQPVFFQADASRGGGGDDPFDWDEALAAQFRVALRYQLSSESHTPDPYGLSTLSEKIVNRADMVGNCLVLLAPALRPIASGILSISGYSDKRNGHIVAARLKGMDLDTV